MHGQHTIADLARMLAQRVESVCRELLPNGRREGREWCVGSTGGEEGRSLKVHLDGDKAGVWRDFAQDTGGDLVDLWREVSGADIHETLRQVKQYLGIHDPAETLNAHRKKPAKRYGKPKQTVGGCHEGTPGWRYLTEQRGIHPDTVRAAKLGEAEGAIVFRYARDGKHVHSKFLALKRDADGKKKTWSSDNTMPCLYGWQMMRDTDRSVVICEGEIDCLTLRSMGIPALSVPNGAGRKQHVWIEIEYDRLERFDAVFVLMDNDEAGQQAADEIVERLGAHRVRVIEWPEEGPNGEVFEAGCDANDLLVKHQWTIKEFARLIMAGKYRSPVELRNAGEYRQQVLREFGYGLPDESSAIRYRTIEWDQAHGNLRFMPGELSIWSGRSKSGKSQLLGQVIAGWVLEGDNACVASMEMKPPGTLYRMARQLCALEKPDEAFVNHAIDRLSEGLWIFDLVGTAKLDRLCEVIAYATRRHGVTQAVVDSLLKLGIREDDWAGQKEAVERLCELANELNIHVHLVAHSRKSGARDDGQTDRSAVRGSGGITDLASNVIFVTRNKGKEQELEDLDVNDPKRLDLASVPDASLVVDANRTTGWEKKVWLRFDPGSLQYNALSDRGLRQYLTWSQSEAGYRHG